MQINQRKKQKKTIFKTEKATFYGYWILNPDFPFRLRGPATFSLDFKSANTRRWVLGARGPLQYLFLRNYLSFTTFLHAYSPFRQLISLSVGTGIIALRYIQCNSALHLHFPCFPFVFLLAWGYFSLTGETLGPPNFVFQAKICLF